ncbi:MAG: hypothetical protein AAGF12_33895 [Myxococcota bacterium]
MGPARIPAAGESASTTLGDCAAWSAEAELRSLSFSDPQAADRRRALVRSIARSEAPDVRERTRAYLHRCEQWGDRSGLLSVLRSD